VKEYDGRDPFDLQFSEYFLPFLFSCLVLLTDNSYALHILYSISLIV
jgi:hypothetical protein